MKYLIILSLLFSNNSFAQTQGSQDNVDKAMQDVKKMDDPLSQALDDLNSDDVKKAKPVMTMPTSQDQASSVPRVQTELQIPKASEAPKVAPKRESPMKLTKEESEMLKTRMKSLKDRPDLVAEMEEEKKSAIYDVSKARNKNSDGYVLERDSSKVLTKYISVYDTMNIKMCFNAGVQIVLEEDITSVLQIALIDDKNFFDALMFDNFRGAYARLKQPIPEGNYLETAIRLVRKDDDKTYVINLIGLPCPAGYYPFPKMVYLRDKNPTMSQSSKLMTPENNIIGLSGGLPRVNKNAITVHDMLATSGSHWVSLGIEIQFPNRKSKEFSADMTKYFKFLDNLQISELDYRLQYLPVQSKYVSEARGVPTMRFEVKLNVDKNYILNNQFIYMMFLDKEEGHYQYVKIDTLPYFISLKQRGFEL